MHVRRLAMSIVAAAGLVAIPALPVHAAPSGGCPYPPNRPVLSLVVSPLTVTASQAAAIYGSFKQNNCGIHLGQIQLQHRALVSGKPSGSWSTFATRTTDANGLYVAATAPVGNEQIRAVFHAAGAYPATTSRTLSLLVREHVSTTVRALSGCRLHLGGSNYPAKPGRTLLVQSRGPRGHFHGWTTLWSTSTDIHGRYFTTRTLTCGRVYNLAVYTAGDSTSLANRSRTIFGVKTHP